MLAMLEHPTFPIHDTMGLVNPIRRLRSVPATDATPGDPLAECLKRVATGDEAAFATMYDELSALVFGIVRRVLIDPSQSEEVTQEVFLELWRLAPSYDSARGSAKGWAATIAHRRAVDRVRSEQSRRERDDAAAASATPLDNVSETVLDGLDHARVRRSLESLSAAQREAIELAYFGPHTYREVAAILGVAEGTAKTRIRDGMIQLRRAMGAQQ